MTVAVLSNPDIKYDGDALSVDVPAGSLFLPVQNAGDFEEEISTPVFVVVGNDLTPLRYVEVENDDEADQQWVKLAAPTTVSYEAGVPVSIWDAEAEADDKRAPKYTAMAAVDDQPLDPFPVTIPHDKVPLAGAWTLEGARVSLVEFEASGWEVENILGRSPVVNSGVIATPQALGILNATESRASSGIYTTVNNFGSFDEAGVSFNFLTGIWTFSEPGMFLVIFSFTFGANSSGARGGRIRYHYTDGTSAPGAAIKTVPVEGTTSLQVTEVRKVFPGQGVSVEVRQNSGGDLDLLGSDGDLANRPTTVSIVRVAM